MVTFKEKLEYLKNYETYCTFNGICYFSRNVKVYKFVPPVLREDAYKIVTAVDWGHYCKELLLNVSEDIFFEGRNGGHAVLDGCYPERWDNPKLSKQDVAEKYKLVNKFDRDIDKLQKLFIRFVKTHTVESLTATWYENREYICKKKRKSA